VKKVTGVTIPFNSLHDNEDIQDYLDYIHESLINTELRQFNAPASASHDLIPTHAPATGETQAARRQIAQAVDERDMIQPTRSPMADENPALRRQLQQGYGDRRRY
jgi:hypothetical protein